MQLVVADLVQQDDIVHDRMQVLLDEDIAVALDDLVYALLVFKGTRHDDQTERLGQLVGVPRTVFPDQPVGGADGLVMVFQHVTHPASRLLLIFFRRIFLVAPLGRRHRPPEWRA